MPSSKKRVSRSMDRRPPQSIAAPAPLTAATQNLPPVPPSILPPTEFASSGTGVISGRTPRSFVGLTWRPPLGVVVTGYDVQWATNSTFTANVASATAAQRSATVPGLIPATAYWFRVRAIVGKLKSEWSSAISVTTASDTVASDPPTGLAWNWSSVTAELTIKWTNPSSNNLRDIRVQISASNGGSLLREEFVAGSQYVWTLAQQAADTSNAFDPSVFISIRSISTSGVISSTAVTATATKSAPANITGLTSTWDLGNGDLGFTCNAAANATAYRWTLDGVTYTTTEPRFIYTLSENRARHSGTADGSITYSVVGVDPLGQTSPTPVTGTATKARPANITGMAVVWNGATGMAVFDWTDIADAVRYQLTIDGIARNLIYSKYDYPIELNSREHSGTAQPSLVYSIIAVDALGQTSVTPTAGTTSLALPTTPTGVQSNWDGDTGVAPADCSVKWFADLGVAAFRVTVNDLFPRSVTQDQATLIRLDYPYETNQYENNTPALTFRISKVDAFGRLSTTPAVLVATNAAPPQVAAVNVYEGFSTFAVAITESSPIPEDLAYYRVRVYKDSVLQETIKTTTTILSYRASAGGSWHVDVAAVDTYGQVGAIRTSAAIALDFLTLATLRAEAIYSDVNNTPNSTLKPPLSDDNGATGGIGYTGDNIWRWTQFERPLSERYKPITVATSQTTSTYLAISSDGVTWSWFAGPLTGTYTNVLTSVASEAAAQSAAFTMSTVNTLLRYELPTITEARYVRWYHRRSSGTYSLREFYPRRLVQSDDIQAESIQAINIGVGAVVADKIAADAVTAAKIAAGAITAAKIAAGAVTADKISVTTLSAITSNIGTVNAGTINGVTIVGGSFSLASGDFYASNSGVELKCAPAESITTAFHGRAFRWIHPLTNTPAAYIYCANASTLDPYAPGQPNILKITAPKSTSPGGSYNSAAMLKLEAQPLSGSTASIVIDGTVTDGTSTAMTFTAESFSFVTGFASFGNGLGTTNISMSNGRITMTETTTPSAPGADKGIMFLRDNGSGKTQLCIIYNTGGVRVLDTQP